MIESLDHTPSPTASWAEIFATMHETHPLLARLTPAEQVVATQLCRGLSNREIADLLGKSPCTVKNQVHACLHKLQVKNRVRLIALLR